MSGILLIAALSVVVEGLVQYSKNIYNWFAKGQAKTAVTQLVAIVVAVLLCFSANADLFRALGIVFEWPTVGVLLTGIFASRGANYVSDFISKLQNAGKSE